MLARKPGGPPLCDLVLMGFLAERDVRSDGSVDSSIRLAAERTYAQFLEQKCPPTLPPPVLEKRPVSEKEAEIGCVVCFRPDKNYALAPCFHMCVCRSCARRLDRCPLCRTGVTSSHRIFCA